MVKAVELESEVGSNEHLVMADWLILMVGLMEYAIVRLDSRRHTAQVVSHRTNEDAEKIFR